MKIGTTGSADQETVDASKNSDESIYLAEDRYGEPKEIFKQIADRMASGEVFPEAAILDVGCATGEFLYYISTRFPGRNLFGFDLSDAMIDKARKMLPESSFEVGSAADSQYFDTARFDLVSSIGVLCFLDDAVDFVTNLLSCTKVGGRVFLASEFNDDPVDVVMRYRRGGLSDAGGWMTGWNIFSVKTIEEILERHDRRLNWTWSTFNMPFRLEKRDDPMRAWTIETESNPIQMVNGACQILNWKILEIEIG